MQDKYSVIKGVADEEKKHKEPSVIPNDGSWFIGCVISFLAVVVPPFCAFSFCKAVGVLLKGSDLVMFFASTAIALLVSAAWEETQKMGHLWLMVYVVFSSILYGIISYMEYASVVASPYFLYTVNVLMSAVMLYIVYKGYKGYKFTKRKEL